VVAERYRIVDLIARGGMGEVYRADDLKLGEPVAMKFLPPKLADDKRWLDRFLDEVRVARTVSHPNVCRVYDVGEDLGEHFLTMEYVEGETLSSLQSRIGRLPTRKAEQIAQQLCAGLAAIHDLGILHRDLKPSNILIDDRGHVKVTDFGLAAAGEIRGFHSAAGTPGYVAPESLSGREATVRSDIYQLGLLLFELFTGRPAYVAADGEDVLRLQQRSDPPAPSTVAPDIKPSVEEAIARCLHPDPSARPGSARQVAALLPGGDPLALALEAGQTPSPSLVAMAGRRGRIRPTTAAAIVLAFLVFTVVAIALGSRGASLIQIALLDKPPQVLADRARRILAVAGYDLAAPGSDEAWSLNLYNVLIDEIERTDTGPGRWDRLRRERPPAIGFWYRWSPEPIGTSAPTGQIAFNDPPQSVPGMIGVRLTTRGTLREIVVVDKHTFWQIDALSGLPSGQPGPPAPPPDWAKLFEAANLDLAKFREESPERIPSVYADKRYAWSGVYPESQDTRVRVEAATLGNKLVAFRTVEPDLPGAQTRTRAPTTPWNRAGTWLSQILLALTLIGAGVLAWRNTQAKRGDRAGATRAGLVIGPACFLMLLLQADTLRYGDVPLGNLGWMLAVSMTAAAAVWVLYVAIEPYVRRIWPESIISWTRLIQGRFTDPLVGQSVLVGSAIGSLGLCVAYANRLIPGWLGLPPARPFIDPRLGVGVLDGTRQACGHMIQCVLLGVQTAMLILVGVVLVKLLVRRTWLAMVVFSVVQCAAWIGASPLLKSEWSWTVAAVSFTLAIALTAISLAALVRCGVLSLMAAAAVFTALGSMPITFHAERWYAGLGFLGLALVCALPLYGAIAAASGKTRS
jgi:serine/threonine-protein kinase